MDALGMLPWLPWIWLVLAIGCALYVNGDANRRKVKRAGVWTLIALLFPILGLLLYEVLKEGMTSEK